MFVIHQGADVQLQDVSSHQGNLQGHNALRDSTDENKTTGKYTRPKCFSSLKLHLFFFKTSRPIKGRVPLIIINNYRNFRIRLLEVVLLCFIVLAETFCYTKSYSLRSIISVAD
jgi:hypothetical protein